MMLHFIYDKKFSDQDYEYYKFIHIDTKEKMIYFDSSLIFDCNKFKYFEKYSVLSAADSKNLFSALENNGYSYYL